ncbi:MAG: hypothetical protein OHK0029_04500 [Armatimonadaceae bacterium]
MATLNKCNSVDDSALTRKILREMAERYQIPKTRTLSAFDDATGNYILMDEGWQGYKRVYHVWAHIELNQGKFYIHEDGTEEGIANLLLHEGVPKERIVLAMDAPNLRTDSGFAPA